MTLTAASGVLFGGFVGLAAAGALLVRLWSFARALVR